MTCTRCTLYINGNLATPDPLGGMTLSHKVDVLANGYGAFAGLTNFNLGEYAFYYGSPDNGACTGQTGQSGQSGCTQSLPCQAKIEVQFFGNPFLDGIAPGYVGSVTHFPTDGGSPTILTSGSSPNALFPMYTYTGDCGTLELDRTTFNFTLPGYSGGFSGSVTTSILCTACSGTV